VQGREVRKLSTYGVANVELSVPVEPQTVFNLASISKVFTSVAVMSLVESGKLGLDDPIGKYLDQLPQTWHRVKIRQLLSHTSGLPDIVINADVSLATVAETTPAALKILRDRPLDFEPGKKWRYNQTNYLLLSMLIEKLSGQTFATYCKSHLFAPFGIDSAVYADERKVIPRRASEYTILDIANEKLFDHIEALDYRASPMLDPAGGLNISITDFSRWLVALEDGRLLGRQSLKLLWTPAALNDGSTVDKLSLPAPWRSYGLGWMLSPQGDHPQVGHMGGARTSLGVFPRDDLAIVVLSNLQGDDPDSMLTAIAKLYLGTEVSGTTAPAPK
jgi:CubicO group peptidase (beta-lactamase class C family)